MPIEHERKFLVDPRWLPVLDPDFGTEIDQWYLPSKPSLRIRYAYNGYQQGKYTLTTKFRIGPRKTGKSNEIEIDLDDSQAHAFLNGVPNLPGISKTRYLLDGWEIDQFTGPKAMGKLWLAEWEYGKGKARFPKVLPPWIIQEVTHMRCYSNHALAVKGLPKHYKAVQRRLAQRRMKK